MPRAPSRRRPLVPAPPSPSPCRRGRGPRLAQPCRWVESRPGPGRTCGPPRRDVRRPPGLRCVRRHRRRRRHQRRRLPPPRASRSKGSRRSSTDGTAARSSRCPTTASAARPTPVDFLIRAYYLRPHFKTADGGSGTVEVGDHISFRDPFDRIGFPIVNDDTRRPAAHRRGHRPRVPAARPSRRPLGRRRVRPVDPALRLPGQAPRRAVPHARRPHVARTTRSWSRRLPPPTRTVVGWRRWRSARTAGTSTAPSRERC